MFSWTDFSMLYSLQADFSIATGTSLLPFSVLPQQQPEQTYSLATTKSPSDLEIFYATERT